MAGANVAGAAAQANPLSAFVGNLGSGLGKGLGDAIGGGGGPLVSGSSMDARSFMDGSGWTVSTGGGSSTGGKSGGANGGSGAATPHPGYGAATQAGSPWLMLAMAGGLAWLYFKQS